MWVPRVSTSGGQSVGRGFEEEEEVRAAERGVGEVEAEVAFIMAAQLAEEVQVRQLGIIISYSCLPAGYGSSRFAIFVQDYAFRMFAGRGWGGGRLL